MKKLFSFILCTFLFTAMLSVFSGFAMTEVTVKEVAARHIINGLNKYNGADQGTYKKLSEYDGYTEVIELHTLDTAQRVLSGDSYPTVANFTDAPIKPGMKLEVVYKYVPDRTVAQEDTPTDLTTLLSLKPQMISTSPNLGTVTAVENIVADKWAVATYRLGDYVTLDNTVYYSRGRFFILSIGGSGAATGTKLASEGGTAIHVDPKDTLYIARVRLVQECYDVTLNLCGGSIGGDTSNGSAVYNGSVMTLPAPEKDGYTFLGWSETENGTVTDLSVYAPKGDTTLYAVYKEAEKVITVNFDLNGGNINGETAVDGVVYSEGTALAYPQDPEKQYRFFKGWTTTKDDKSTLIDKSLWKPQDNTTLYAYYDNEKVLVDKNSGTLIKGLNQYNSANQGTIASGKTVDGRTGVLELHTLDGAQRVLSGNVFTANLTFTDIPVKPGMKLVIDYKYVPDRTVAQADTPTDITALTAKKPQMKMTAPEGGFIDALENIKADEWASATFRIGDHVKIGNAVPLTTANIFMLSLSGSGASTGTVLQIEKGTAIHVDPKDTLYIGNSKLIQECYVISFDLAGGNVDGQTAVAPFFYEGESIVFPEPVREGYNFCGWGYNPMDYSGIDTAGFVPAKDITLYALWTEGHIGTQSVTSGRVLVKGAAADSKNVPSAVRTQVSIDGYDGVMLTANEDSVCAFTPDCWSFNESFDDSMFSTRTRFVVTYKYVPAENTDSELGKILSGYPSVRFGTSKGWTKWIQAKSTVVRDTWATAVFEFYDAEFVEQGTKILATHAQLRILGLNVSGAPSGTNLDWESGGSAVHLDGDDKVYIGEGKIMYKYDYDIKFDANGGGGGSSSEHIIKEFGGAKFDGALPVKIGYSFMGWAKTSDASKEDVLSAGYMPDGDVTLYAVWEEDSDYALEKTAVVYPLTGERGIIKAGNKLFADGEAVFGSNIPSYFCGAEFTLNTKSEKTVRFIEEGWMYALTPATGENSDADSLVNLGFVKLGEIYSGQLSDSISEVYAVYGKFYEGTKREDIIFGSNTILVANIVLPDDSLEVPEIILNPAEKLIEHPEYAQYLDGNRKFGGCPAITQTKDGTLWLSVTSGGTGEDMYNYAGLKKSTDGGITWSEFVLVADPETPVRTSEPFVWCDPDGRLWFWWSQMFNGTSGNSDGRMGVFMIYSDNNGTTWSEPVRLMHGFSNQNPIILKDGTWAMPVNIWNNNSNHSELNSLKKPSLYTSKDKGLTWTLAGTAQNCSDSWFWENSVMEKADGTLVMYYRTVSAGVEKTESVNGGKDWSDGVSAGISLTSARTATIELKNGSWLFISHDDEYAAGARSHMTVWLSEDEGETLPYKLQIDTTGWYPAAYEGNDGFIYITYDRNRADGGCAMLAKITVEDIKAGKLVTEGSMLKYLTHKGNASELPQAVVSFDTDGGKDISNMSFRTVNNDFSVPYTVRTLPKAQKDGYKFIGWATEKGGAAVYTALEQYTPSAVENVTLFAVYEEEENTETEIEVSIPGIKREEGTKPNPGSLARLTFIKGGENIAVINEDAENTEASINAKVKLSKGTYDVKIEKNGYVPITVKAIVDENGITLEDYTLVAGDIKATYEDVCGDGKVDIDDFIRVLRGFAHDADMTLKNCVDINEDGYVNVTDLACIKANMSK